MFLSYEKAMSLPKEWSALTQTASWFQPEKLSLLESLQPCQQKYHLDPEAGVAFVSYSLGLNALALHGKNQLKIPVQIVGLPISLAECGYHAPSDASRQIMTNYLRSQIGIWIILNAVDDFTLPGGDTLPSCHLPVTWKTFDQYLAALRSPYRRWISKGMEKGSRLKVRPLAPEAFSVAHYQLYEDVHARSPYKLEKLGPSFFQQFPARLYEFCLDEKPVGFIQLSINQSVLAFLFCGFDGKLAASHHLYLNMLLWMVQLAIEKNCSLIDFGQTTEETKTKLGATIQPKKMYLSHRNPVIYSLMHPLARWLSYPGYPVNHHVFKESSP